ncbi:DUF397 domain-containing protein [Kitasatospora sp. NPDC093806]|uniref:DUF397 domain-containing protein n=1 Tax=Kitasatospora sp. NPDC093806 TaxID=3155075 RepID=UPI003423F14B
MLNPKWQKSSFSGAHDTCVEICRRDGLIDLRESDEGDMAFPATRAAFTSLLRAIKAGEFDAFGGGV